VLFSDAQFRNKPSLSIVGACRFGGATYMKNESGMKNLPGMKNSPDMKNESGFVPNT